MYKCLLPDFTVLLTEILRRYLHSHSVGKFFINGLMDLCNHLIIVSQNLLKNQKNLVASTLGSSFIIEY